jgi:hypothetical protein
MTSDEWELRQAIIKHQCSAQPLGQLFEELYRCQATLAEVLMDAPLPIIGLVRDDRRWRGRYMTVGPLGLRYWTELNADAYKVADECLVTLAHELAHWYCDVHYRCSKPDHDWQWKNAMLLMGLVADDNGRLERALNHWDVFETEHAGDLAHILLS